MKPFYYDACCHDRPRDRYLGTFDASGQRRYDVYVYQDNGLIAAVPDMHVCLRYGSEDEEHLSLGNAADFVRRVQTERLGGTPDGKWPDHYVRAAELIEKWVREGWLKEVKL
jgi:hypothetical protein